MDPCNRWGSVDTGVLIRVGVQIFEKYLPCKFLPLNSYRFHVLFLKCILSSVSGDANFHMEKTALTVGGFTQPNPARALIELPASIEKGLGQRFLWMFPPPSYANFSTLELVDEEFSEYLGNV